MIDPEDIISFLNSPTAKECTALLKKPPMEIVAETFYKVRYFLLWKIIQTNAQRPMAVRNISEKAVHRAKVTESGGCVISVSILKLFIL